MGFILTTRFTIDNAKQTLTAANRRAENQTILIEVAIVFIIPFYRFTVSWPRLMLVNDINLARFFAWARPKALPELEARLKTDPTLDPNWTFSDIMQKLLEEYRSLQQHQPPSDLAAVDELRSGP